MKPIRFSIPLLALVLFLQIGCHSMMSRGPAIGSIERLDPALDKLVPRDAKIEKLATGFSWAEGPVWVSRDGALLFSDVPQNVVHKWTPGKGVTDFLKPSGYTGSTPRGGEPGS